MMTVPDFDPAWLGYAGVLLVFAASLSTRPDALRIGVGIASLLGITAVLLSGQDAAFAALFGLVLAANLVQLARHAYREAHTAFSDEEQRLRSQYFGTMAAPAARRLIDQGHWIAAKRGEVLIREHQAAPSLFYLADGSAEIRRDGVVVGLVSGGELIGEATVLDGDNATGTVELATSARLWFVPAPVLRGYLAANPAIAASLHEGFARALRGKLASANTRLAGQPMI